MMNDKNAYASAIMDFQKARRKAEIQNLLALLTGKSDKLLSYEDVRQQLRAVEGGRRLLRDIPLDAVVGSVGRYSDFNRDFLPRRESAQERWARVMAEATGPLGLPPIETYKIGDAYFVLDGNHRVSVAKQLDAPTIQGYVTEVKTRIPITPDLQPDDLILKAEQTTFLEQTNLNKLRPDSDLSLTLPGRYPILLEHIAVHQYFMGIDEDRDVPYEDAVVHWYDIVYLPVVEIIRERGILNNFPNRTEADLYIWLAKHRTDLEEALGWQVDPESVADDLVSTYTTDLAQTFGRATTRLLDVVTPDALESGPSTGAWRKEMQAHDQADNLFRRILVGISKDDHEWQAFEQAVQIARRENAILRGLHVVQKNKDTRSDSVKKILSEFDRRCQEAGIQGDIAIEVGSAARQICERAQWADLVIGKLAHPPANQLLSRLSSGFRIMVRRCSRPIWAVPGNASSINKVLLAYNGSPKADEALFIAAYMTHKWDIHLIVLTIDNANVAAAAVQGKAQDYLCSTNPQTEFLIQTGPVVGNILNTAAAGSCDLIVIGGYKANPVVEIVKGSLVDQLLRETSIPTLICR